MSWLLADTTWADLPVRPLVIVPVGSTEQHGPHLPTSTDTLVATAVAEGAARRLPGEVVVAPALAYGSSGEHQGFAGTVSIGADALRVLLLELVRSLAHWAARVVLVNGHGGNVGVLTSVVPQLAGEGHDVGWVPCSAGSRDAHAGFTETCLVLHLAPSLVHRQRAAPGNVAPLAALMPALVSGGVAAVAPSGVLGDPTGASAAEGARLLEGLVADVVARLRHGVADPDGRLVPRPVQDAS